MSNLIGIGAYINSNAVMGIASVYYVRADGTATLAEDATSSAAAGTSLNMQTLYNELANESIGAGSTIMLSSQGGDYADSNVNLTGRLADRSASTQSMFLFWEGVTYTNVPNEHVVIDCTGIQGTIGTGNGVYASCFLALGSDAVSSSRVKVGTTGSITIDGSAQTALVEARSGAGAGNYGIKCIGLTCLGNATDTSAHDIYSAGETAEMEIIGGTVTGNHRIDEGTPQSTQVFTTHVNSKMKATDTVVDGMTYLFICIGTNAVPGQDRSALELNNITASNVKGTAALLSVAESDVVLNDCTLTAGAGPNCKFVTASANIVGTTILNNCTVRGPESGSGATSEVLNGQTGTLLQFNNCTVEFPEHCQITMNGSADLEFNDCVVDYSEDATPGATRRFEVTTGTSKIRWERCIIDCRGMTPTTKNLVRVSGVDRVLKAGSGMFACEIWNSAHVGIVRGVWASHVGDCGWVFDQCTFLECDRVAAYQNSAGYSTYRNCHFSGLGPTWAQISTTGAGEVGDGISFFGSAWGRRTDFATLTNPAGGLQVTDEGFGGKTNDPPDLTIDATSDMYHAGVTPDLTYDRTGTVEFDDPASIGCYEAL